MSDDRLLYATHPSAISRVASPRPKPPLEMGLGPAVVESLAALAVALDREASVSPRLLDHCQASRPGQARPDTHAGTNE